MLSFQRSHFPAPVGPLSILLGSCASFHPPLPLKNGSPTPNQADGLAETLEGSGVRDGNASLRSTRRRTEGLNLVNDLYALNNLAWCHAR